MDEELLLLKGVHCSEIEHFSRSHRNRKTGEFRARSAGSGRVQSLGRAEVAVAASLDAVTQEGEFSERTTIFPRGGLHKPQGRRSLFLHLVAPRTFSCPSQLFPRPRFSSTQNGRRSITPTKFKLFLFSFLFPFSCFFPIHICIYECKSTQLYRAQCVWSHYIRPGTCNDNCNTKRVSRFKNIYIGGGHRNTEFILMTRVSMFFWW